MSGFSSCAAEITTMPRFSRSAALFFRTRLTVAMPAASSAPPIFKSPPRITPPCSLMSGARGQVHCSPRTQHRGPFAPADCRPDAVAWPRSAIVDEAIGDVDGLLSPATSSRRDRVGQRVGADGQIASSLDASPWFPWRRLRQGKVASPLQVARLVQVAGVLEGQVLARLQHAQALQGLGDDHQTTVGGDLALRVVQRFRVDAGIRHRDVISPRVVAAAALSLRSSPAAIPPLCCSPRVGESA
ncbi:hypothetical protein FQR65_LT20869 [Abscondita terminalis]|nr:hypothetical protein FQR65_LT20869 [Abscondita terminalis]